MASAHPLEETIWACVPPTWPRPASHKYTPARWYGDLVQLRVDLLRTLDECGQDADDVIWHTGHVPRSGFKWFAPGVPMRRIAGEAPRGQPYALPARAALLALDLNLVSNISRPKKHGLD